MNCVEINVSPAIFQGQRERCSNYRSRYRSGYSHWYTYLDDPLSHRGCRRICYSPSWVHKCCKNHYGRDCQGKEGRKKGREGRREDAPVVRHLSHSAHRGLEKIVCLLKAPVFIFIALPFVELQM